MLSSSKLAQVLIICVTALALFQQAVSSVGISPQDLTTTQTVTATTVTVVTATWVYATSTTSVISSTTLLVPTSFNLVFPTTATTVTQTSTQTTTEYRTLWTWALFDVAGALSLTAGILLGATSSFALLKRRDIGALIGLFGIVAIGGVTMYINYPLLFVTLLVGLLIGAGSYLVGTHYRRYLDKHFK
jgi:hypothetical protein